MAGALKRGKRCTQHSNLIFPVGWCVKLGEVRLTSSLCCCPVACAGCVDNERDICKTANNILTGASDGTVPLITVDAGHRSECMGGCAVCVAWQQHFCGSSACIHV